MVNIEKSTSIPWRWQRNHFTVDRKRNMPAYKVGKLWKFKLSEVDDWIRSGGAADDKVDDKEGKAK